MGFGGRVCREKVLQKIACIDTCARSTAVGRGTLPHMPWVWPHLQGFHFFPKIILCMYIEASWLGVFWIFWFF